MAKAKNSIKKFFEDKEAEEEDVSLKTLVIVFLIGLVVVGALYAYARISTNQMLEEEAIEFKMEEFVAAGEIPQISVEDLELDDLNLDECVVANFGENALNHEFFMGITDNDEQLKASHVTIEDYAELGIHGTIESPKKLIFRSYIIDQSFIEIGLGDGSLFSNVGRIELQDYTGWNVFAINFSFENFSYPNVISIAIGGGPLSFDWLTMC